MSNKIFYMSVIFPNNIVPVEKTKHPFEVGLIRTSETQNVLLSHTRRLDDTRKRCRHKILVHYLRPPPLSARLFELWAPAPL